MFQGTCPVFFFFFIILSGIFIKLALSGPFYAKFLLLLANGPATSKNLTETSPDFFEINRPKLFVLLLRLTIQNSHLFVINY